MGTDTRGPAANLAELAPLRRSRVSMPAKKYGRSSNRNDVEGGAE
jgi:hypothetical protein